MTLYRRYRACSQEAEVRMLTHPEAMMCHRAYLELKLSFIEGIDHASFRGLSVRERHSVNLEAYKRLRSWLNSGPE